ncbi:MAG: DUF1565 domain-containing protein [Lentisphaerae bacterium]|nr:DUF1565 domain-containing protein [Lentisphaerota bacterium]
MREPNRNGQRWLGLHLAGCAVVARLLLAAAHGEEPAAVGVRPSPRIPADFAPSPTVEFYGNFETAGVVAVLPADVSPEHVGRVRCALNVEGQWRPVHDLVRVGTNPWYATSLFWLQPGRTYQVKVEAEDRAGNRLATTYGTGSTRPEPIAMETARTLHVATDGDDANPGTLAQPYRTLQRALDIADARTTVLVRGGTYYEGNLTFAHNGTVESPILLKAFNGERAILDAADPGLIDAAAWHAGEPGLYRHAMAGGCNNVSLEHKATGRALRLYPVHSLEELRTRTIRGLGPWAQVGVEGAYLCDGTTATLAAPGPLSDYRIYVARQTRAFVIESRRSIQVDGLEMAHLGKDSFAAVAMLYDADDILFQNCRARLCNAGIWVKAGADRVTIQDCGFTDVLTNWAFNLMKSGTAGIDGQIETGCVYVDATYSGRGLVVRRNRISGLFDGAHIAPGSRDSARSNETDFYRNIVEDVCDDFVEVDGIARNVRVFENRMNRSLSGVSMAQALEGPTFVLYNVLANCGMVRAAQVEGYEGYPFKTNGGGQPDIGSGQIFLYHNTAWTADPQSRALLVKGARWARITFRNNIWCGRKLGFDIWTDPPSPMDFDYDDLYVEDPAAPLVKITNRNLYMTLDRVRTGLGYLRHGISAAPLLANPDGGVYTLQDASPCIDAGAVVAGINDVRMQGAAPDLGAFERR